VISALEAGANRACRTCCHSLCQWGARKHPRTRERAARLAYNARSHAYRSGACCGDATLPCADRTHLIGGATMAPRDSRPRRCVCSGGSLWGSGACSQRSLAERGHWFGLSALLIAMAAGSSRYSMARARGAPADLRAPRRLDWSWRLRRPYQSAQAVYALNPGLWPPTAWAHRVGRPSLVPRALALCSWMRPHGPTQGFRSGPTCRGVTGVVSLHLRPMFLRHGIFVICFDCSCSWLLTASERQSLTMLGA